MATNALLSGRGVRIAHFARAQRQSQRAALLVALSPQSGTAVVPPCLRPARRGSARCRAEASSTNGATPPATKRPVIVWYKHDLRTHDHAGLSKAIASGRPVLCFFCFDPATLADQLTHLWGPAVVHGAVHDLRKTLEGLGCPLVVRTGDTVQELLTLVQETNAEVVSSHSEVEVQWLQAECAVEEGLPPGVELKKWRAPIWQPTCYEEPTFLAFRKRRGAPNTALPAPGPREASCDAPPDVATGDIPTIDELTALFRTALEGRFPEPPPRPLEVAAVHEPDRTLLEEKGGVFLRLPALFSGGESAYIGGLRDYLRYEQGSGGTTAGMRSLVEELELIPGNTSGSFTQIFQAALALGIISRRRAYAEALAHERERNGGLPPFLGRFTSRQARAAADVAECGDYHVGLAHRLLNAPTQAGSSGRSFWRWNGQLVDFLVAEPEGGVTADTQTILLVHGFGAFAEHWRRNVPELAARGYRVFACTLPGFGPSEKSPQLYTTAMWKAYVRDFVINVVQAPVTVAGNSIGGVIPANACADHPHLFEGIVLINTAGSTDETYDPDAAVEEKAQRQFVVNGTSWLVFNFLQRGISKQLARLYPVRPFNADAFLNAEIYRASCDPCALQVLRSGFYLSKPRPLPYLMNELYQGPVLVLQGVLDPLNKAQDRADKLEACIERATKVCIDAGHCPHDEVPELVNDAIDAFVRDVVGGAGSGGGQGSLLEGSAALSQASV